MRILILLSNDPCDGLLVKLHTAELVREVKEYIAMRNNSKAMLAAVTKGTIEQKVDKHNAYAVNTDLILTKDRASWDVRKIF